MGSEDNRKTVVDIMTKLTEVSRQLRMNTIGLLMAIEDSDISDEEKDTQQQHVRKMITAASKLITNGHCWIDVFEQLFGHPYRDPLPGRAKKIPRNKVFY